MTTTPPPNPSLTLNAVGAALQVNRDANDRATSAVLLTYNAHAVAALPLDADGIDALVAALGQARAQLSAIHVPPPGSYNPDWAKTLNGTRKHLPPHRSQ